MKVKIQGRKRRVAVAVGADTKPIPQLRPEDGREALQYSPAVIAATRKAKHKARLKDKRERRASQRVREAYRQARE